MKSDSQRGMITLEACISVLTFILLMLFFSSFFVLFMVQNMTAHAILQTSQSLSLDVYRTEQLIKEDDGKVGSVSDYFTQFVTKLFGSAEDSPYFVSDNYWHKLKEPKRGEEQVVDESEKTEVADAVKLRFIGYFASGDEEEADYLLEYMNVVDGLDGLDFSESYVENDTLYIVLRYELTYDFDIWGVSNLSVEQKACSKLWKSK
ncbi:MAG: hypothetical protein IJ960_09250 [Oscillospiraceae bacterium]|nr:hypothetical protein [Oscillospiraceae bacterium]